MTKILLIPDTQVRKGVPLHHLEACGNYIVEKKPDVIVHIGDHFDMPSLSTYAKRKEMEGRRVMDDIIEGKKALNILLNPLCEYNKKRRKNKEKMYSPKMHFCCGNHEQRMERYIQENPQLDGVISYPECFGIEEWGFEVHEFLKPVEIEGINFAHYFYNPMSGRPYGGTAHTKLKNIKTSFVAGHTQGLDIATSTGNNGQKYWGIVAGSFYLHDENYKGPQANDHFRGIVMLHNVKGGDCNPCIIGMDYLLEKYL